MNDVQRRDIGLVPGRNRDTVLQRVARRIGEVDRTEDAVKFHHDTPSAGLSTA
jgi:hypothetical protein